MACKLCHNRTSSPHIRAQERKIELAADKAMKAAEKEMEAIPPGMRVLGEQERLETLGRSTVGAAPR